MAFARFFLLGSSPLMRGKPYGDPVRARRPGLIPAHAGKTRSRYGSYRERRAHPRSCGETKGLKGKSGWRRAHPRSCGENFETNSAPYFDTGSSPLMRGKRLIRRVNRVVQGLIPAHAGKTSWRAGPAPPTPAHPRSRGENDVAPAGLGSILGSSPLTRGKRVPPGRWRGQSGLIPAHAGKTFKPRRSSNRPAAHPRSRGENFAVESGSLGLSGSSPLTRGKRWAS